MLWALPACFLVAKGTKKVSLKTSGQYSGLHKSKAGIEMGYYIFTKRFFELCDHSEGRGFRQVVLQRNMCGVGSKMRCLLRFPV